MFISNSKQDLQLAKAVCKLGAEQLSCSIENKEETKIEKKEKRKKVNFGR